MCMFLHSTGFNYKTNKIYILSVVYLSKFDVMRKHQCKKKMKHNESMMAGHDHYRFHTND